MAVQIWPQPNVLGSKFPDFVVRRADDSYIVVEIETPAKIWSHQAGSFPPK